MVKKMKKWSGDKIKKAVPSVFYILTLISRDLSRDDILQSIMDTAGHFREIYSMDNYEALERAVSKRRFLIRDKLAASAKETENSTDGYASDDSMESSDNNSSDGSGWEFDIWEFINDILDDENVSDSARTKRGVELILFYMRTADA